MTADAISGSSKAPDTATRLTLTLLREKGRTGRGLRLLRTNVDDRLPFASLGGIEGGDGIVEGRHVADVRPQSSVTHPPHDLTQLGTIGLDNEIDGQTVGGPRLDRADGGHQHSPGTNQTADRSGCRRDDIENQIDSADAFQRVVVEVEELCARKWSAV